MAIFRHILTPSFKTTKKKNLTSHHIHQTALQKRYVAPNLKNHQRMKKLLFLALCFVTTAGFCQEINFEWKKMLGDTGHTSGLAIACDTAGNIYASGTFEDVIEYDGTTLISEAGKDGYLAKLNPAGDLLWIKQFSGYNDVKVNDLKIDRNNNPVILGNYRVSVHFDTILTTNNTDTLYSSNMFIAKYTPGGDLMWAKNTGGVSYDGNSLAVDLNNKILITGKSVDISVFDTDAPVNTLDSMLQYYPGGTYWKYYHPEVAFIAKYSSAGNLIWIHETGGYPKEIISDYQNRLIITGYFMDETDFNGTSVPPIGFETTYLAQYTSGGNLNWVKTSGGSANWNSGYGLEVDSDNTIYQCGQILGNNIEFDGNVISPFAGTDAFLTKYDASGNLLWYKMIGSPTTMTGEHNFNSGNALKMDTNGDILMVGYFLDTLTIGETTLTSEGAYDLMLLKFDSDGNPIAASQYTEYGWTDGMDIDTDSNGDIYITGMTTLDRWDSRYPGYAFIGKINAAIPTSPLGIQNRIESHSVSIYPNPTNGEIHIKMPDIASEKRIEIYTIDGRKVNAFTTLKSTLSFEIKEKGMFLIFIRTDDQVITKKVIVG